MRVQKEPHVFGPVQMLTIGFEGSRFKGEILPELERLKAAGVVRIIDLLVIRKDEAGAIATLTASDLDWEEATEYGAYGIAILVIREAAGKPILERSAKGPGFDFWIGDEEDDELPFQGLMRLEVSGILSGDAKRVSSRVQLKKTQVTPSDKQAPALIAVVEFGRPLVTLEKK